ncbi:MAG: tetratricopeptide repeat protein [Caulobacteraceae bacterium]
MTIIGDAAHGAAPSADLIKQGSDKTFAADVIEASKSTPVIVDFWATWCGPCRQLGPILEKAVRAAKGAVKLVKIDIDKNPVFAGQLRVQSIPMVYAFADGRPVDAFMGAVPESQVNAFIDKLVGTPAVSPEENLLAESKEALDAGDLGGAAQGFARVLQSDSKNAIAIGGLARCYLTGGDSERAREVVAMAAAGDSNPDLDAARAGLALAAEGKGDLKEVEARLAKAPDDLELRFELAKGLAAKGRLAAATEELLAIIAKDRDFKDGAARSQLLTVFEAAGAGSEMAKQGRRRLSSILFS